MNNAYTKGDCCYGTFTVGNEIILDNGTTAFTNNFSLPYGTRVLCTVCDKKGKRNDLFVKIDSVMYDVA